jgi:protoporphyrinogen oxidase
VGDALKWFGLYNNKRLRTFLDLQLKLYSQVTASETALLYAATALGVSQTPQGLYHLQGSMQVLSDRLGAALERDGGKLLMRHSVEAIAYHDRGVTGVVVRDQKTGETRTEAADIVVANVTVQNLVKLLGHNPTQEGSSFTSPDRRSDSQAIRVEDTSKILPSNFCQFLYRKRVQNLPTPSSAFVVYLGVKEEAITMGKLGKITPYLSPSVIRAMAVHLQVTLPLSLPPLSMEVAGMGRALIIQR